MATRAPPRMLARGLATALSLCALAALAQQQEQPRLTRPPKVKKYVAPAYPEEARKSGQTAVVTLTLDLGADGQVLAATPVGPLNPLFDAAAVTAALQLEFEPAEVDGVPAPVRIAFRYRFSLEEVKPTTHALRGRVVDRESGAPVAGAALTLRPSGQSTVTDERGAFAFEALPSGVYVVELASGSHLSTSVEQPVPTASDAPVEYRLARRRKRQGVDEELVIRIPKQRRTAGAAAVAAADARSIPGVMGDALAVVQNLPGVARASAGSGEVVVWGSAPAETRIYVDDVPIPYLYHRGGLRSVVNDALVSAVELVPGGFGPAHGRATGGLVQVTTTPIGQEGLSGYAGADFIDASAALAFRERGEQGHAVAVGGRYGYLDRLLPRVAPDIQQVVPLPSYWDYAAKWQYRAGGGTTELLALGASDRVDRRFPLAYTDEVRGERSDSWFHRLALEHEQPTGGGGSARVTLYGGVDQSSLTASFGARATSQQGNTLRAGVRASRRKPLTAQVTAVAGLDVEASRATLTRAGTLSLPAREGDAVVFGQPPGDSVNFDRWTTHQLGAAPYLELELGWSDWLLLTPGLRLETFALEGERRVPPSPGGVDVGYSRLELFVDPRLRGEARVSRWLTVHGALGLYHQPADPADLSAVFGSTALTGSNGAHAVLGASVRLLGQVTAEGAVFGKLAGALAARSLEPSPGVARALVSQGESQSHGAQLVVRPGAWRGLSGWVSYSYLRAERRDQPAGSWRPFDFDQTHVLVAVASYELFEGMKVGARYRASTGYPRTGVTGAYFDARSDTFQPRRSAQNEERLPAFSQLDLRMEKVGKVGPISASVYLDLVNVLQQPNAEEVVYSHDYTERRYLTGLPFLAVLGLRVEG